MISQSIDCFAFVRRLEVACSERHHCRPARNVESSSAFPDQARPDAGGGWNADTARLIGKFRLGQGTDMDAVCPDYSLRAERYLASSIT